MSGREIIFHIGHAKCASTSVQAALIQNVDVLRERGIVVADRRMEFPVTGGLDGVPTRIVHDLLHRGEQGLREALDRIHQGLAQLPVHFDRVIVSAESLCNPQAEYLAMALRHEYRIRVVYYVRRPAELMVSGWAQWGCREGLSLDDYVRREIEKGRPDYVGIANAWASFAHSMHVRPLLAEALAGGGVLTDFFAVLGLGDVDPGVVESNTMLDWAVLEVFAASAFLFEDIHDREIDDWIRKVLPRLRRGERPRLCRDLLRQIAAGYDGATSELARRFYPELGLEDALHTDVEAGSTDSDEDRIRRMQRAAGIQLALLRALRREAIGRGDGG